jgi:hypothetical protein
VLRRATQQPIGELGGASGIVAIERERGAPEDRERMRAA